MVIKENDDMASWQVQEAKARYRAKPSLARFLRDSPLFGVDLDLQRDRSAARDMHL